MKKLFFLVLFMLTVFISAKAQILQSSYLVGDLKISRVMLNLVEENKWEPYHLIESNHIRILFLNPEKDFDILSLNHAINKWKRFSSPELKLVVMVDDKMDENAPIPSFHFQEGADFYIFHNDIYSIGRVEWRSKREEKKKGKHKENLYPETF